MLYSSLDGLTDHPVAARLEEVRRSFNVHLVYGRRRIASSASGSAASAEVILIDVSGIKLGRLNTFKAALYRRFGLQSDRYEHCWDYEQYVRLAEPAVAALKALNVCSPTRPCVILAHEFMGMPTALAAMIDQSDGFGTIFYAHEVAPVRKIVEEHPGHDTMFYNVLEAARAEGRYIQDVFGSQGDYFKFALVEASQYCDNILAVGDYVVRELLFLGRSFEHVDIDLSYNGIPAQPIGLEQARQSKRLLQQYAQRLLGYRPDYVLTHVSRMVVSKGLWRDLRVLEHLEERFRRTDQTAVVFMLTTELPRRRPEDIYNMEQWWDWPVAHREGLPDLSGGEAIFYAGVQAFNARARNIKIVMVNQFGWDPITCGRRMPEQMQFMDIRTGTDVEFGQSIYEPFGIAQLEPLGFGGICVISRVCGCAGFIDQITAGRAVPNVLVADYTDIGRPPRSLEQLLAIDRAYRERVEQRIARQVADELFRRLPRSDADKARLIE
ncbi:MAG: hypothetical protein ACE5K7_08435, partial [Phycisphaerae bacterium]